MLEVGNVFFEPIDIRSIQIFAADRLSAKYRVVVHVNGLDKLLRKCFDTAEEAKAFAQQLRERKEAACATATMNAFAPL